MPVLLAPEIWFVSYCSSDRQVYVYDVRTINPLEDLVKHMVAQLLFPGRDPSSFWRDINEDDDRKT